MDCPWERNCWKRNVKDSPWEFFSLLKLEMDSTRDWIPNLSNSTYIRRVPKTSSLPFSRRLTSLQLRLEKERPENGKVRTKQHIILLVSWYSCKMTSRNKPFPDQLTRDSKVRSPHLFRNHISTDPGDRNQKWNVVADLTGKQTSGR